MAAIAATRAMKAAGVRADDVDLIVVATITPDLVFPSSAALLQARLGARHIGAFDLSAACSGFVYGLALADAMISCGKSNVALVVGSERMSNLLDWSDRSTCVLFGDGAGAAIMVSGERPGVRSTHLHADGANPDVLRAPSKQTPYLHMHGASVFKFAVRGLVEGGMEALNANNVSADSINLFIPHQANLRIIEAAAKKLGIADERVAITVDRHANTSAASIPLALDTSVAEGRLRSGDTILLVSVGGGFTWASALIDWT
jgi:3-oxoacyl-[acyl-carrier-protein] synthase-3